MCFKYRENLLNYTNSIQIDLRYILNSHDYFGFIRKKQLIKRPQIEVKIVTVLNISFMTNIF